MALAENQITLQIVSDGQAGPQGPAGADGQDGYSPTARVTKSGDTATITITDKTGTTTQTVSDGADGQDGAQGPQGPIGPAGQDGTDGQDGKSAYESAQDGGYSGTESQFNGQLAHASETATNYIKETTDDGLYVTDDPDTLNNAVKIDSDSVDIIKGGEEVASFGEETKIGKPESFNLDITQNSLDFNENDESALGSITAYTKESSKGLKIRGEAVEIMSTRRGSHSFVGDATIFSGWQGDNVCQADISVVDFTNNVSSEINVKKDRINLKAPNDNVLINNKMILTQPSLVVVTYESSSKSISGSSSGSITQDITKAGYYPLSIAGTYCSGTNVPIRGAYLTNVANGSATINYYLRNVSSSAQSVTVTTRVLWVKI